jgi:hypothetical protein
LAAPNQSAIWSTFRKQKGCRSLTIIWLLKHLPKDAKTTYMVTYALLTLPSFFLITFILNQLPKNPQQTWILQKKKKKKLQCKMMQRLVVISYKIFAFKVKWVILLFFLNTIKPLDPGLKIIFFKRDEVILLRWNIWKYIFGAI